MEFFISGINKTKPDAAQIAYLEKMGKTVPDICKPPKIPHNYLEIAQVINKLMGIHPPNPVLDISYLEIIAACRGNLENADDVCEVIAKMNETIANKLAEKSNKQPEWIN